MRSEIRLDDQADQREDVEVGEDHRIVAVEHRAEAEQAEPIEREDVLDQQRAGEEGRDEGAGKAGDDDQHGIAEDVAVEHLPLGQALGARGHDILLADLVEERVLGEQRRGGEGRQHHGGQRQRQVPEIVEDLAPARTAASQFSEVRPRSGNQSKNEPPANSTISRMANRKPGMA